MPDNDFMEEVVRRISALEAQSKRLQTTKQLFEILNLAAVDSISANQNNYDPANYDVVFIAPAGANRTINGFSGGVKGRVLWVANRGSFSLSFTHNSGSADAGNRIATTSTATVTIASREFALLIYVTDTNAYSFAPNWALFYPEA